MKIAFVQTPAPWLVQQNQQTSLGPLYLATVLKSLGYDVKMFRPQSMFEINKFLNYDILCMSATTLEYPYVRNHAWYIKRANPKIKILLGGAHVTAMGYDFKLEKDCFDAVCFGEGERAIKQMIRDLKWDELKSHYYMRPIDNIDSIPIPDRSLIPGSHGGNVFSYNKNYQGKGNENFITSRGCPFGCAFCSSKSIWGRRVRFRSIENIKLELAYICKTSEIRQLRICDDNLTANPGRLIELCKAIKDYNFIWRCSVRADDLTPEICKAMYESGCREISPGLESGDQRVLDFLQKKGRVENMTRGCKIATETGINVRALMMIGTPGERQHTPEINMEFLDKLKYNMMALATFVPLPGSDIWRFPEKFNCEILTKDFRRYNIVYWRKINGKIEARKYDPLIRNYFLTMEQQTDNVKRMEKYFIESDKFNRG